MSSFIKKALCVKVTFSEPVLGSAPSSPDVYEAYIVAKDPEGTSEKKYEEVGALDTSPEKEEARMTVFPKTLDGRPIFWDYQIKGFFKDACGALRKVEGSESSKIKAYKQVIDKLIFVYPRQIVIETDEEIGVCRRSLRASTPKGDRTGIAVSEQISAGATAEFEIEMFDPQYEKLVREWLDYGMFSGMSQWRNSGMGRFTWEETAKA